MDKPMIHKKMANILASITPVDKDGTNEHQKYKFRSIAAVYQSVNKAMAAEGVYCVPEVVSSISEERESGQGRITVTRILTMKYTFFAEDGSSVSCTVQGEGTDTSDKASNKAMAAAHKYALTQPFVVPYKGMDDGDNDHIEPTSRALPPNQTLGRNHWKDAVKAYMKELNISPLEINSLAMAVVKKPIANCTENEFEKIAHYIESDNKGKSETKSVPNV